jgi:hypothetical protein
VLTARRGIRYLRTSIEDRGSSFFGGRRSSVRGRKTSFYGRDTIGRRAVEPRGCTVPKRASITERGVLVTAEELRARCGAYAETPEQK